jgi:hypothetical protein
MKAYRPLTPSSDRRAEIPPDVDGRRNHIERALTSLDHEARRVERLGLEDPQVRCEQERRYWAFLAAVHAVTHAESTILSRQIANWLAHDAESTFTLTDDPRPA